MFRCKVSGAELSSTYLPRIVSAGLEPNFQLGYQHEDNKHMTLGCAELNHGHHSSDTKGVCLLKDRAGTFPSATLVLRHRSGVGAPDCQGPTRCQQMNT